MILGDFNANMIVHSYDN